MRSSLPSYIGIGLICGVFLLLGFPSLNEMIIYTPDSARYLAWANSLAQFDGFKDGTTPEPSRYVAHAPLYPILLAPGQFLFPQNVVAAKATTLIFGVLTIFMFYIWMRTKTGEWTALLGSALLALNPLMLIYSTQILSDVPFALCFILLLYFAEKMTKGEPIPERTEYSFLAILTAGIFVRDIGLTLMVGAVLFFLWKKQYRRAAWTCMVPLVVYLVWFVRNEVIIAGVENPSIRNSRIFFMHLYTSNQEGLLAELGMRLWNNLTLYTEMTVKLLFMPDFAQRSLSLISPSDLLVASVFQLMPVGRYLLIAASVGLCAVGVWQEFKNNKPFLLIGIVLLCYLVPILLYPINDIRFLFPLLIVMIYFWSIGLQYSHRWWMEKMQFPGSRSMAMAAAVLILLPNITWLQSYVRNSYQYGKSPEEMYAQMKTEPEYPGQFAKPLHLAGMWIAHHQETPAVVLSRWKELAFWMPGGKVIEAHPQITPDTFEYILRDYSVKYLVAVVSRVGLNEFEGLMNRSRRYAFVLVYRVGDVEIFEVKHQIQVSSGEVIEQVSDSTVRSTFRRALLVLEANPLNAKRLLDQIPVLIGGYSEIVFQKGVAMEFAGELDSALVQFDKFRSITQAGAFLQQASYHRELVSRLKKATASPDSLQRAEMYQTLAVHYWELGYRKRAMDMLSRSLEAKQRFFPALIISALFSYQQGDTAGAWMYLLEARSLQSDNILTAGLTTIQQCCELLVKSKDRSATIGLRLKIVDSFISMGLREQAIDDLVALQQMDPENQKILQLLGELFEGKQRYEPALRCYSTILLYDVTSREARQKVNELLARF